MAAGLSHWKFGNFSLYSVNPPLVRTVATAPIVFFCSPTYSWKDFRRDPKQRSEVKVGRTFLNNNQTDFPMYFFIARVACIPFALLGTYFCWRWSNELFGSIAGIFAAGNWAFSPLVLGHGSLITSDVAAASIGLIFFYTMRHWLKRADWSTTLLVGVVAAFAMLVKSTWIFAGPICVFVWLCCRAVDRQWMNLGSEVLKLMAAGTLALFLVNVFYGFEGSFRKLGDYDFVSEKLSGEIINAPLQKSANRFRDTWIGRIPIPLPQAYLSGMDIQKSDFERSFREFSWRSYLFGSWKQGGWWYYYLVGIAVKEPLPWVLLLIVSCCAPFLKSLPRIRLTEGLQLLLPAVAIIAIVSSQTGMSRNIRYALPALPFLFIWTSQFATLIQSTNAVVKWIVLTGSAWFLGSVLWYAPHWISYFNETVGGPNSGYKALIGSNIDWGQDLFYLKDWLTKHPEVKDLKVACMTCFDPSLVGIKHRIPEPYLDPAKTTRSPVDLGPHPGWYAISVDYVVGSAMHIPRRDGTTVYWGGEPYRYFSQFQPVDKAGYSIFIYHLELEDVQRVRKQLGLPLLSN